MVAEVVPPAPGSVPVTRVPASFLETPTTTSYFAAPATGDQENTTSEMAGLLGEVQFAGVSSDGREAAAGQSTVKVEPVDQRPTISVAVPE